MPDIQDLPEDLEYAFAPAYEFEDRTQQIRIVIKGLSAYCARVSPGEEDDMI